MVTRLELIVSKFKMSDDFFSFCLSNVYGEVPWLGVQLGTFAMADLILVFSIFVLGAGCGYYVRDRFSKQRREQYLRLKHAKRSRNAHLGHGGRPSSLRT